MLHFLTILGIFTIVSSDINIELLRNLFNATKWKSAIAIEDQQSNQNEEEEKVEQKYIRCIKFYSDIAHRVYFYSSR